MTLMFIIIKNETHDCLFKKKCNKYPSYTFLSDFILIFIVNFTGFINEFLPMGRMICIGIVYHRHNHTADVRRHFHHSMDNDISV